jgi:hypothetical protein
MRSIIVVALIGFGLSFGSAKAQIICGTCSMSRDVKTLRETIDDSDAVILARPICSYKAADGSDRTEFIIEHVVKHHPSLKNARMLTIPVSVRDVDPKSARQMLIFGAMANNAMNFYRGDDATPALAAYVKSLPMNFAPLRTVSLRHSFEYLDSFDSAVRNDAQKVLRTATTAELRALAQLVSKDALRLGLRDGRVDSQAAWLYGYLLGLCGSRGDAELLLARFQFECRHCPSTSEQLLVGYAMLDPKSASATALDMASNAIRPFLSRYAILRAMRFLRQTHPRVISEDGLAVVLRPMLEQEDMADLVIETFRAWNHWKQTEVILGLFDKKELSQPIIKRSILRYALTCPESSAKEFVAKQRKRDAAWVAENEEILKFER